MSLAVTLVAWSLMAALLGLLVHRVRRGDLLGTGACVLLAVAWFFKVVFPGLRLGSDADALVVTGVAMLVTGRDLPLPVPSTAFAMYLGAAAVGVLVAVSSNDDWLKRASTPILEFLSGARGHRGVRLVVLFGALPALVSWTVLARYLPSQDPPVESRQAHPSIPYDEAAQNPYRDAAGVADPEALQEGREQFAKNCRPCHGMRADGVGPMARGFRLRPANFHDPGTIATLVEPYAMERVRSGGIGLPANGSPWDSAMPRWKDDLDDDVIWKILLAEYEIGEVNPRVPEAE